MARIRILRPNVSRDEAVEIFSAPGPSGYLRDRLFGQLRSVAEFYVPFRLFQVEISNRGERRSQIFGLDAVTGSLDLYEFETLPEAQDTAYVITRNHADPILNDREAGDFVVTRIRRILYLRGFFRFRDLRISASAVPGEFYVPYWVGFRGRSTRARIVVLDALRRCEEGAKVKTLLRDWLTTVREEN